MKEMPYGAFFYAITYLFDAQDKKTPQGRETKGGLQV